MINEERIEEQEDQPLRDTLCNSVQDYADSCNRQGIPFNDTEKKRFLKENKHMKITTEEEEYIWNYE